MSELWPVGLLSYLLAEKISCSAELSMKKVFITLGPDLQCLQREGILGFSRTRVKHAV